MDSEHETYTAVGKYHQEDTGRSGGLLARKMETTTEPTVTLTTAGMPDGEVVVWLTEQDLEALLKLVREGEE